MAKTNLDLVKFAEKALKEKWYYVYGTYGQIITQQRLNTVFDRWSIYTTEYKARTLRGRLDLNSTVIGKRGADCSGLIKAYLWWTGDNSDPTYNRTHDKSANGFFSVATEKGYMDSMPEIPGILVHFSGHIGIYIGNGQVIEAKGATTGVVQTRLSAGGWKNWSKCPYIDYVKASTPEQPEADKYIIHKILAGHSTAADALNRVNKRVDVAAGEYFVFRKVGNAINVTKRDGSPGSWIDSRLNTPSDNAVVLPNVEGTMYNVHVNLKGYYTSVAALAGTDDRTIIRPGKYHIFRQVGNAFNISTRANMAGSWIDDRKNIGNVSTIPTRPNNPYAEPSRTLSLGLTRTLNEVRWLQFELRWRYGSEIVVDGRHGPITQKWLLHFQKATGLVVDGQCGPATRLVLKSSRK